MRAKWLLLILFSFLFTQASATHFRYATMTWKKDLTFVSATQVRIIFNMKSSWRWSFPWPANPPIGATLSVGSLVIVGSGGFSTSAPINVIVTSVNVPEDYLDADYNYTAILPITGYPFNASFTSNARISTLRNNNDLTFRVETIVTASNNNSPVASIPAIVNMPVNTIAATYPVPAVDPDGGPVTLSLAIPSTFGGGAQPVGLSVSGMNMVFDTRTSVYPTRTVGSLWNAVLNITDAQGGKIALDVIIRITAPSTPPSFVYPPTPPNSTLYDLRPLNNLSFPLRAADSDVGDIVTITGSGFPTGVSFSATNGNPANATFSWMPTNAQIGTYVINFTATDVAGVVTTSSVTIRVSVDPEFIAPTLGDGSILCAEPGVPIATTFSARDLNVNNTASISAVSGVVPGMNFSPALPTAFSNTVSTNLNWTPAATDWGVRALVMRATNQINYFRNTTVTWIVNNRPVITSTPVSTSLIVGQPFSYTVVATDADIPQGDHVEIETAVLPSFLAIVDNGDNTFTISGTPTLADVGTHNVLVEVEDELNHINGTHCGNEHQTFDITVSPCNLGVTLTPTPPTCVGGSNGSVLSSVTGVNGTATYAWSNSATSPDITNVGEGNYSLTVTDDLGCTATQSTTLTAPADVTPPTVTNCTGSTNQADANCVFNGSGGTFVISDQCPGSLTLKEEYYDQNNNKFTPDLFFLLGQGGYSLGGGRGFPVGTNTVVLTVTDAAGNVSQSCSFTVVVTDNTAPVITTNGDQNVNNDAGVCGASVQVSASAADNCTVGTPTGVRSDGLLLTDIYPLGVTTITWNVTDANGNAAAPVTQTVTVADAEAPIITCNAPIVVNNDAGQCGAVVTYTVSATDNCTNCSAPLSIPGYNFYGSFGGHTYFTSDAIVSWSDANSAAMSLGGHLATVASAAENAFLSNSNLYWIGLTDQVTEGTFKWVTGEPLGFTGWGPGEPNNSGNEDWVEINRGGPGRWNDLPAGFPRRFYVEFDCLTVTQTAGLPSGSVFPVGTTTNTFTVTDAAGNTSTCSFNVTVNDNEIPVISTDGDKAVNTDPGVCGAAVSVTGTATDNCSVSNPAGVRSDGLALTDNYPVGTTTITWDVQDINGNVAVTVVQTVTVTDNENPVITCPATQRFCSVAAGIYSIPVLIASDNCGIGIVSYAITGATTRSGNGYDASGTFSIGTSTITWTVKDIHGNESTCTTTVVIWPLPVASITASSPNAFCNTLTLTASSTLSGPYGYAWIYAAVPFANTETIDLNNTNGDGNYSVFVTDGNGCRSAVAAVYNYQKQNIISNYTILATKEVEMEDYSKVQTGSVGIMKAWGEAEFKKRSSVTGAGAFVKAPRIQVESGSIVPIRIIGIATVTLPAMQVNTSNTNWLPNYTVNQNQTITLNGNYKDLKIKKGANVILNGTIFGKIDIEEGAVVRFTSMVINIGDLKVGKGPNNGFTSVKFADNTSIRISKQVKIEEDCIINPDGVKVTFYLGDEKCDEEKFQVKGGNTTVTANIYAPGGKIKVQGGDNCHHHASQTVYMNGLFIADEVESEGKSVTWNSYNCNAAPVTEFTGNDNDQQVLAVVVPQVEGLKVTVSPNPTLYQWTLRLQSNVDAPVSIRILNSMGQVVDGVSKANPNSTVSFGGNLRSGMYMAEVLQGKTRQMIRLVKGN